MSLITTYRGFEIHETSHGYCLLSAAGPQGFTPTLAKAFERIDAREGNLSIPASDECEPYTLANLDARASERREQQAAGF